jgi:5'-deoxynucleotidase YfbR-like HD superfamily hydrolase
VSDNFNITWYGHKVDFVEPDPAEIDIRDIAHAAAVESRFTGHTDWEENGYAYGVAQHCVAVARSVKHAGGSRREQRAGLLHDAAEAYVRDLSTPLKKLVAEHKKVERRLLNAIFWQFDLPTAWSQNLPARVKHADQVWLATEARDLCHPRLREHIDISMALPAVIEVWEPRRAKREFLALFEELTA